MSYRILILSCNTGEGHNSAARALQNYARSVGIDCDLLDALSLRYERISKTVSELYELSVRLSLFSRIYALGEWYNNRGHNGKSPLYHLCKLLQGRLSQVISDNEYDAVICTHLFPAEMLTHLRSENVLHIPAFFVATDYTCYPFLAETDLDGYMIAHSDLIPEYARKGMPAEKIFATGIPCLSGALYAKTSRMEARQKIASDYWWDCSPYTGKWFLIIGGSMGFGNLATLINELRDLCAADDKIVCVCGRNERLKQSLGKKYKDSSVVRIIGYTDKIPLLMDACDVLLTKPGGLTSTEAMNRGIPLVHTLPIKGVEDKNARFYSDRNISFYSDDSRIAAGYAVTLSREKECRKAMLNAQNDNRIADSSKLIIDHIISTINNRN